VIGVSSQALLLWGWAIQDTCIWLITKGLFSLTDLRSAIPLTYVNSYAADSCTTDELKTLTYKAIADSRTYTDIQTIPFGPTTTVVYATYTFTGLILTNLRPGQQITMVNKFNLVSLINRLQVILSIPAESLCRIE